MFTQDRKTSSHRLASYIHKNLLVARVFIVFGFLFIVSILSMTAIINNRTAYLNNHSALMSTIYQNIKHHQ